MQSIIAEGIVLTEWQTRQYLRGYDVHLNDAYLVQTDRDAVERAEQMGYPVVLKLMSQKFVHKSDSGAVALNLHSAEQVQVAYQELFRRTRCTVNDPAVEGVIVQPMVQASGEAEIFIGVRRDSVFGNVVLFGIGGSLVELLKDVSHRVLPVTLRDVSAMVEELKFGKLFQGYRGASAVDLEELYSLITELERTLNTHPEIEELELNPVLITKSGLTTVDARLRTYGQMVSTAPQPVSRDAAIPIDFTLFLNPKSIAIVGASDDRSKQAGRLTHYLIDHGYGGRLIPVNPSRDEIAGLTAYRSVLDIPGTVDLACIVVPSHAVPNVFEECMAKGIKSAIVYSSGFAESGPEGQLLQQQLVHQVRNSDMRFFGPNTIGVVSPHTNIFASFSMSLQMEQIPAGNVGLVSQSGALGSVLLSRLAEQKIGISHWISTGNEANIELHECIEFLIDDPKTAVITMFVETIRQPDAFRMAAERALKVGKPLVVYKTGKSTLGRAAVQTHTGSLAGDDSIYDGLFRQLGVIRVSTITELIDVSWALSTQPRPGGPRIGVVTASGGVCSMVADQVEELGLELAEFPPSAVSAIASVIPPFGAARNPVDITIGTMSKPDNFASVLRTVASLDTVDAVIVMLTTAADPVATPIAQSIIDISTEIQKPFLVGRLSSDQLAPVSKPLLVEHGIPVYSSPDRVLKVFKYMYEYARRSTSGQESLR